MKNKKFYILSFIIPISLFLLILFVNGLFLGKNSILISDLYYQYYNLFNRLKEILEGNGSLFYTYKIGLGQSFISTFAYYLASPLNLLIYFFNNMEKAIKLIITLKIGLCGLTMFIYLKNNFKNENIKLLLFSTAYALSLQVLCNYFNIMWLDAYYLAPLVLLGIDKLINENKSILYFITLFLSISINYYTGYMICIFSVIYFIYKLYLKYDKYEKEISKIAIRFIIVSILAGMSSMFINFPNLLQIFNISRDGVAYINGNSFFNFNILQNLSKIYFLNHDLNNPLNKTFAYFYFSIFGLLNLILYFLNNNITKKEKKSLLFIILILLISMFINPINKMWHGFSSPLGFNYRYYFLFLIIFLCSACKNFMLLDNIKIKKVIIMFFVFMLVSILCVLTNNMGIKAFILSNLLFIIYFLLLLCNNHNKYSNISKFCLTTLVLLELYSNGMNVFDQSYLDESIYLEYRQIIKNGVLNKISDDSKFYRIEFNNSQVNDAMLYNYNSTTSWYSTINLNIVKFLSKFGYKVGVNEYTHAELPLLDSILNIKYYIDIKEQLTGNVSLEEVINNNVIEKNKYNLNLGFMIDNDALNYFECESPYLCQENLVTSFSGEKIDYYIEGDVLQDNYNYIFTINNENNFIVRFPDGISLEYSYDVYLNDNYMQTINQDSGVVSEFLNNKNNYGSKINISIKNIKGDLNSDKVSVYYKNEKELEKMYEILSKHQFNISTIEDGYIKGNIVVPEDKNILFLSIPYENGWKAIVDGKEQKIIDIYDTFIGLKLENGTHEIEFIYKTPGLKIGISISALSILLYGVYLYLEKKHCDK